MASLPDAGGAIAANRMTDARSGDIGNRVQGAGLEMTGCESKFACSAPLLVHHRCLIKIGATLLCRTAGRHNKNGIVSDRLCKARNFYGFRLRVSERFRLSPAPRAQMYRHDTNQL